MNFIHLRILGALTIIQGLMYFPPILEFFWGWRSGSAPMSFIWCVVQVFFGVALCSREWMVKRIFLKTVLICNLVYQLIWSFLIIDLIARTDDLLPSYLPYLLHILSAAATGIILFKVQGRKLKTI